MAAVGGTDSQGLYTKNNLLQKLNHHYLFNFLVLQRLTIKISETGCMNINAPWLIREICLYIQLRQCPYIVGHKLG